MHPHVQRVLRDLTRPEAWHTTLPVEMVQTHASIVFLVGDDVYKVKKPVDFGFLDYTTLAARRLFAEREVTLNRRLAPDVYLGVCHLIEGPDGRLQLGEGEPIEVAVHMRRLDDADTLRTRHQRGGLAPADLAPVGRYLGRFHVAAARPHHAAPFASFEAVATNARDNLDALEATPWLDPSAVASLRTLTEAALAEQRSRIEARAHTAAELHGDLRMEHVYLEQGRIVVLDGIEFNDAFRLGDPASDIAFLIMDLTAYGAWAHAAELARSWLDTTGDPGAAELLPLYISYRSAVRAKVAVLAAGEDELPDTTRRAARARAELHTRMAEQALRPPRERARLLLTAGLPGTGKSTVARALAQHLPIEIVRTDEVRKHLAGLSPTDDAAAPPGEGLYTPAWTARTYARCLELAEQHLRAGRPVLVDASFRTDALRAPFQQLALRLGVPFGVVVCTAPREIVLDRLAARTGDASDADASIYQHLVADWQHPNEAVTLPVDTTAPHPAQQVLDLLPI